MSALAGNVLFSGTTTFVPLPVSDLRDPTKRRCSSPFVLFDPIFDRDMNMRELPCAASLPSLSLAQLVPSPTAADHRLSKGLFDNQRAKSRVTMKRQDAQLGFPLPDSVCDRNHFDMIFPFNYRDGQIWYRDFFAVLFIGCIRKSLNNE